jgi:hypothetical protein
VPQLPEISGGAGLSCENSTGHVRPPDCASRSANELTIPYLQSAIESGARQGHHPVSGADPSVAVGREGVTAAAVADILQYAAEPIQVAKAAPKASAEMTTPETAAETAAAAKMTSAAKVFSASAAKVASTTAKVPSASAATAPECDGASRRRSYADGKCCSNCNHHFAHGISPWVEFAHCLPPLKFSWSQCRFRG